MCVRSRGSESRMMSLRALGCVCEIMGVWCESMRGQSESTGGMGEIMRV